jgi:hypothetical protein
MVAEPSTVSSSQLSLRALKLRPGMFLQTQAPTPGATRGEAQFCAAIDGRGIMVVPLSSDARDALRDGERRLVHGFTGIYDFSFEAEVLQSFTHPFAYTLLSYPKAVSARKVRNAQRIRTALPARVSANGGAAVKATIIDLSPAGAMLTGASAFGATGEQATIAFAIEFERRQVELRVTGTVCHSGRCESGEGYRAGYSFKQLGRNDRLALQYFALASMDDSYG